MYCKTPEILLDTNMIVLSICCTLRSWFFPWIGEQSYINMLFWQFSIHHNILRMYRKVADHHFNVSLFSNPGDNVLILVESRGKIWPIVYNLFRTLSPGLENNNTLKCWSGIFPYILGMLRCMTNCQNNILI